MDIRTRSAKRILTPFEPYALNSQLDSFIEDCRATGKDKIVDRRAEYVPTVTTKTVLDHIASNKKRY